MKISDSVAEGMLNFDIWK